jgi:CRP/FNR family transcriptional regulator, anaerobic regulatory protein
MARHAPARPRLRWRSVCYGMTQLSPARTQVMPDSARFALHRPELREALCRGDGKLIEIMKGGEMQVSAGTLLIEAHTEHPFVYRMVSGWAARSRTLADARDQFILVFLPGDLFAVKSMFVSRHTDDVLVLSDAVIQKIHYRDLHAIYDRDSDVANRCIWQVVEEERRLHNWVVGLGQGSAEERLAALLIDFHGRLALSGSIPPDAMTFEMPLTQAQIGDHLGITAVHVNRVLRVFREQGVAVIRDGHVRIEDFEKLQRTAYLLLDHYERTTPEYQGQPRRET